MPVKILMNPDADYSKTIYAQLNPETQMVEIMRAQARQSFSEAKLFELDASSKILDLSYRSG